MITTAMPATHFVDDRRGVVRHQAPRGRMTALIWLIIWLGAARWIASAIHRYRTRLMFMPDLAVRSDVARLHEVPRVPPGDVRMTGPHIARLAVVSTNLIDRESAERDAEGVSCMWASQPAPGFARLYDWPASQSLRLVAPPANKSTPLRRLDP
jgi:hypothetical protein